MHTVILLPVKGLRSLQIHISIDICGLLHLFILLHISVSQRQKALYVFLQGHRRPAIAPGSVGASFLRSAHKNILEPSVIASIHRNRSQHLRGMRQLIGSGAVQHRIVIVEA